MDGYVGLSVIRLVHHFGPTIIRWIANTLYKHSWSPEDESYSF